MDNTKIKPDVSRQIERKGIITILGKLTLGKDLFSRFIMGEEAEAKLVVQDLIQTDEWKGVDSSLQYIILKGFGALKEFPAGYGNHQEFLNDLLGVAKKLGIETNKIPSILREKLVTASCRSLTNTDDIVEFQRPDIAKEVSFSLDSIIKFGKVYLKNDSGFEFIIPTAYASEMAKNFTPKEVADFLINCTKESFPHLRGVFAETELGARAPLARYIGVEQFFVNQILPLTPDGIKAHKELLATRCDTHFPNDKENLVAGINGFVIDSIEYWRSFLNSINASDPAVKSKVETYRGMVGNVEKVTRSRYIWHSGHINK